MPLSASEWLMQQPGWGGEDFNVQRMLSGTEDEGGYRRYLEQINQELMPDITDPYGNIWTAAGQGYRADVDSEGNYTLAGGPGWDDEASKDYVQGLSFQNEAGATYIPQIIANQLAAAGSGSSGWMQSFLDSSGPVMLLASLFTAGAASGFGAGGGAAGTAASTGAGGASQNALGLQQMAAAAGLPPGSAASEAFIASGGTMGSTAAGGLGGAGSLAEAFGYATPAYTAPTYANWYDPLKTIAKSVDWTSGFGGPGTMPYDFGLGGEGAVGEAAASQGAGYSPALAGGAGAVAGGVAGNIGGSGFEMPTIQDTPLPPPPKPGAPNYQELWGTYAGWMDNVNRINEGAFADVRARLSAAGAAPDLIKMQTEHLESQRLSSIEEFNKSTTFSLLEEGHNIAMGNIENRYEGGLSRYAGEGKPELMDFYTELYGQPARGPGPSGTVGTGGTPSTSGQTAVNPWFEDAAKISLI